MVGKKLVEWRSQIDRLDRQILELLAQRAEISSEIMEWKRGMERELLDEDREKEILEKIKDQAKELGLNSDYVGQVYSLILKYSKKQ
jgi:chorismate mutase